MSAVEQADTDIDAQLAAEFCRELKLRGDEIENALAMRRAARDAVESAREAVQPAQKRAWLAQLRGAAEADELTRRVPEASHEADRARREFTAATQRVRDHASPVDDRDPHG